ncbi:IS200/IS605 family transposase [Methanosalsum natronophilum]|nr:IS200/IS605 family transposase [Methanosalsum natronophilum]MCS3923770.1 putative transposase [Methanosalsum natronophilum]
MSYSSSAVYEINYHIVWCTKYRKQVMNDELKQFLDDQIRTIADSKEWEILELEVMPAHIHLFISAPPFIAPTDIVKIIKGVTAKRTFQKFPELRKKEFLGNHLWSPSYYIGSHGQVSAETIKKYIDGSSNRGRNSSTV